MSNLLSQPMLAGKCEDVNSLRFPVLASPKLDGIRCLRVGNRVLTRKFKEIPNHYTKHLLGRLLASGMDGEIMVPGTTFNALQSRVMSEGAPRAYSTGRSPT